MEKFLITTHSLLPLSWMEVGPTAPLELPAVHRAHLRSEYQYHRRVMNETGVAATTERLLEEMKHVQHECQKNQVRE